jgi:hypothetical protein
MKFSVECQATLYQQYQKTTIALYCHQWLLCRGRTATKVCPVIIACSTPVSLFEIMSRVDMCPEHRFLFECTLTSGPLPFPRLPQQVEPEETIPMEVEAPRGQERVSDVSE